jgi:hypothetical protein
LNTLHTQMNEPANSHIADLAAHSREHRKPFLVRESDVERAREIADEFYPQNRNLLEDQSGVYLRSKGDDEVCARICELTRMLRYHPVKTRMLVVQWRHDLVGLERKLQSELDEGPQIPSLENGGKHARYHHGVNGRRFNTNADGKTPSACSSDG